jgi:hypothetical protein
MRLPSAFPCARRALALAALIGAAAVLPATAGASTCVPPGPLEGAKANPSTVVHVIVVAEPGVTSDQIRNR